MSQVHELTAPARSDPASSSGASTLMNSEPNPNSNSAAKKEAKRPEKEAKAVATGTTSTPAEEKKSKDKAAVDGVVPFVNTTPKEQKKDFSGPMAAGYDPIAVEAAWYAWWLEQGFFKPDPNPRVTHSCDRLYKTSGKTRHDLGRVKFLETVMDWKNEYQERITDQLHRLGGSYDGSRVAFTMDPNFCRLHEEGIIYRANRLVNWCVRLNTTLSNLEVTTRRKSSSFGIITSFAYPIENSDVKIIVATTMLGDTAIAVHHNDVRYKHLHGKFAVHPFVNRRIPIVTDDVVVDMTFGTGAVEITPAHDPNNYLDFINILNDDSTFNANARPNFHVVKKLKELGLYIETRDNPMPIPICRCSGNIIEPMLKPQWWVNCKPLAEEAIKRTRAGEFHIAPKQSEGDWYFVRIEGRDQDSKDGKWWVVGRDLDEATERGENFTLEQDEDTVHFDKFYPTSMLETGWDILFFWVARMVMLGLRLTGKVPFNKVFCHAMIRDAHGRKMSKSLGNAVDPLDVIQGLLLEKLHEKLYEGNLDAQEIEKAKLGQKKDFPKGIPQCGTGALRFALCTYSRGGRDINLEILRAEGYRKFCNKIFNATKFAMLKLDKTFKSEPTPKPTGNESLVEKWILHKLNTGIDTAKTNKQLGERNFIAATNAVYNLWLYELCDVYIVRPSWLITSAQQTLYTCLDHGLRLLHTFMPFVTEELWQRLSRRPNDATPSIMVSRYPIYENEFVFDEADKQFDLLFSGIRAGRSLPASYNLQPDIQSIGLPSYTACTSSCGLIDLDAEIAKCEKKLQLVRLNLDKVRKVEAQLDYVETVPENVRSINEDRKKTLEAEVSTVEASKEMFAQLK
ncbi:hypothetical protein F5888DRAFT_1794622 [Russula emetica]|nr:hypothetical protein F5888DRAFT_1794622 [Russula emetica]